MPTPVVWFLLGFGCFVLLWAARLVNGRRKTQWDGWHDNPTSNRNAWAKSAPETDSPIEEKLLAAMRALRELPEPVLQYEIRSEGRRLTVPDFAYPDQRILIFVDSKKFHAEIGQLIDDAHKRNALAMHGYIVLVYWGPEIYRDAAGCARNILEAYRLRQ